MATIAEFLQRVNDTKPGECYGKCGKMVTEKDKDHAEIAKMPQVHVTFANDNPEVLMKPSPAEVRTFHSDDPPSDISSTSSEEEEPLCLQTASDMLKRSAHPWVPPHKRVKAPGPTPLVRKEAVETYGLPDYDLALHFRTMTWLSSAMRSSALLTRKSLPTTALDASPAVMPMMLTAQVTRGMAIIRTAT